MNGKKEVQGITRFAQFVVHYLSFEFYLSGQNANGGTVIFLRAISITATLLLITMCLHNLISPDLVYPIKLVNFRHQLIQLAPWGAALFAGCYVALYTRFSAQWSYLANLYNMIKQAEISMKGTAAGQARDDQEKILCEWKAGYIEDALELHLSSKSNVAAIIKSWGSSVEVEKEFRSNTFDGDKRWDDLMKNISAISERHGHSASQ